MKNLKEEMKKFKVEKKKAILLATAVVGLVGAGIFGSYSYFTDDSNVTNEFTTGSLDLRVTENLWENSTDGKYMYPGYTVAKYPTVKNVTGIKDNDAYVEAILYVKDHEGNPITDSDRLDLIYHMIRYDVDGEGLNEGTKYPDDVITQNPNVNPAFEFQVRDDEEGTTIYFLKDTLKSTADPEEGEDVVLFTKIAMPTEWSQTEVDLVGDFQIVIEFKGIQAATFEDVYDAMEALLGENIHVDYNEDDSNRSGIDDKEFSDKNHSEDKVVEEGTDSDGSDAEEGADEDTNEEGSDVEDSDEEDEGETEGSNSSSNNEGTDE